MKPSFCLSVFLIACGGRPEAWDREFSPSQAVGLNDAVAVIDSSLDRALLLSSPGPLELRSDSLPIGKNPATVRASPDGTRLFVLSEGVQPRLKPDDELPRLTLIDTAGGARAVHEYPFTAPVRGLVLDPELEWAVVFGTAEDDISVRNPNEITLIDLVHLDAEPIQVTIQSPLGSSPQRFTFTSTLQVPNGAPRRLLVVQTEREVTLLDLSDAAAGDARQVTQPLPENQAGRIATPADVVFHDREVFTDANGNEQVLEPELAVRFSNDTSVLLLPLAAPAEGSERPFRLEPNIVDVGGQPTTIQFVRTDDGIRLIALVDGKAALVDPRTSNVVPVTLPNAFKSITRVTEELDDASGTDIALLWSDQATTIGLWNLGASTASASRGLSMLEIGTGIRQVLDVPGDAFRTFKVLESVRGDFYVLDLAARASSPMLTDGHDLVLNLAPDGKRLWAYQPGSEVVSSVNLDTLNARKISVEQPIDSVFDVGRPNGSAGRTAIVLHQVDRDLGATLLNALDPDGANTRFYSGLAYQGVAR